MSNNVARLKSIETTYQISGGRCVIQVDDTNRHIHRLSFLQHRSKEEHRQQREDNHTERIDGVTQKNPALPHRQRIYVPQCLQDRMFNYDYYLITSDIPGRKPSMASTGRALTSKVFKSYCPLALVAFQTA